MNVDFVNLYEYLLKDRKERKKERKNQRKRREDINVIY